MNQRIIPIRERFRKRKRLVVFICTGNTCRSPMAAGYFRKLLKDEGIKEVEVRSAGVMTITGLLPSQEAVQVMEAEGIDITRHRSSQLTPELVRKADLILAMTPFHRQSALKVEPEARKKTFLLKEFTRSDLKNVQIADPMGSTLEVFKKCFKDIKAALNRLIQHDYIQGKTWDLKPMTPDMLQAKKPAPKRKAAAKKATKKAAKKTVAANTTARKKTAAQESSTKKSTAKSASTKSSAKKATTKAPDKKSNSK